MNEEEEMYQEPLPPYIKETIHSMKRRKIDHDYSAPATYLITIATERRQPILGHPVSEPVPRIILSTFGAKVYYEEIPRMLQHYPQIELWRKCIMPDHMHLIMRVKSRLPTGKQIGHVIGGFKIGCIKAYAELTGIQPPKLFEDNFNDRILYNSTQLKNWKRYVDDNPRRLAVKRSNRDLFMVLNDIKLFGNDCRMIGNRFLLDIPDKRAVVVHRHYTDAELLEKCREWIDCAERGGVLVSAAVSRAEKDVLIEASERGGRIIRLCDNGFSPYYKPEGKKFDACAEGRLLQISPWPYHYERRTITRAQCLYLNMLAEEIAGHSFAGR